jgi:hypothetical protein
MSSNERNVRPSSGRLADRTGCVGSVVRFWEVSLYLVLYFRETFFDRTMTENLCTGLCSLRATANSIYTGKPRSAGGRLSNLLMCASGPITHGAFPPDVLAQKS